MTGSSVHLGRNAHKSNYGPNGATVPLRYDNGRFILDPEPIDEGTQKVRAPKANTRLAVAVLAFFKTKASNGQVVSFGAISKAMQEAGEIERGDYETVRKPLQRTLKVLTDEELLKSSDVPRGYRIVQEVPL